MATRKPKLTNPNAKALADAMDFLSPIQRRTGTLKEQYSNLSYNWACASDEVLTIGIPIEADLFACPHYVTFIKALTECEGEDLSIIQLDSEHLQVQSGVFKAMINCVSPQRVEIPAPDPCIAQVDNRVRDALAACAAIPEKEHQNPAFMGVLLQSGSTVGINGHIMLEYWHGVDLPPGLLLPKRSAEVIGKTRKEMTGFGFSPSSVTFWFADGSFIKTQLFKADYPDYQRLFPAESLPTIKLHQQFFKGVKAIRNFAPDHNIYFFQGTLQTNVRQHEASTYKIDGLPEGMAFNSKYLVTMSPYMEGVAFQPSLKRAVVFTNNTRGVIMGVTIEEQDLADYKAPNHEKPKIDLMKDGLIDDDIPF